MLRDFISAHREQILARTRARAATRGAVAMEPGSTYELADFLDQLCEDLRRASSRETVDHAEIRESAGRYGHDLFGRGTTMAHVVHAYGDFCQIISGLAVEEGVSVPAGELQTLGLCLDAAIAGAVTAHSRQGERVIEDAGAARFAALGADIRSRLTPFLEGAPRDEWVASPRSIPSASEVHAAATEVARSGAPVPATRAVAETAQNVDEAEGEKLFVVDQDPHVRRLVRQFVGDAFVVECFDDGYSALDRVRRSAPSALITEILIPGLDGLALCRLLKGDPVTEILPILVSSMLAAEERVRRSGADAFLEKPLEKRALVASLRGLTRSKGRRGGHSLEQEGAR
jgi:CheY-like chemotaxis protein